MKACLNGTRTRGEHRATPLTPDELAQDAARTVAAGAGALHVHPRAESGSESLDSENVGAALLAIRAACPGVPVGVSSGAWIEPDLGQRLALIQTWREVPDFVSVNLAEDGAPEVCDVLFHAGIGIEAGIWSAADAHLLHELGLAGRCERLLIELVREQTAEEAIAVAGEIERILDEADVTTPRLLHGEAAVAWPMLQYALARGYDIRIGLEDTLVLPDGRMARDNAELVSVARDAAVRTGRIAETAPRAFR